jgi:hypothetical protein
LPLQHRLDPSSTPARFYARPKETAAPSAILVIKAQFFSVVCLSIVHYGVILSNQSPFREQLHKDTVAEKRLDCGTIFADALMGVFPLARRRARERRFRALEGDVSIDR